MDFYFAFQPKKELIVVKDQVFTHEIGALLQCVIDIDWTAIQSQVELWIRKEIPAVCWGKHIDKMLQGIHCHPVIRNYLCSVSENGKLPEELQVLANTKESIRAILEALVDEDRNEYAMQLYELVHVHCGHRTDENYAVRNAYKRVSDRNKPALSEELEKQFPVISVTENLVTILYRELRFICTNQFIIRKCINCRNFFWTRSTTKMYCSRPVPTRKTTCSQYGPRRKKQLEKRPAYSLYWSQRAKIFSQTIHTQDTAAFRKWVKETAPYKARSVRGEITMEEMAHALKAIEVQLFPALLSPSKDAVR